MITDAKNDRVAIFYWPKVEYIHYIDRRTNFHTPDFHVLHTLYGLISFLLMYIFHNINTVCIGRIHDLARPNLANILIPFHRSELLHDTVFVEVDLRHWKIHSISCRRYCFDLSVYELVRSTITKNLFNLVLKKLSYFRVIANKDDHRRNVFHYSQGRKIKSRLL